MTALAPTLEKYFTHHLTQSLNASSHTVAAYRDTWRLLLGWLLSVESHRPETIDLHLLDSATISSFLRYLEDERGNSIRTRNARLAALHSFFSFAALHHPEHADSIARVLAIPAKRHSRTDISYLTEPETSALLAAAVVTVRPRPAAACRTSASSFSLPGLRGSYKRPRRRRFGTDSLSNSTRLIASSELRHDTPVMFPPGRAKSSTIRLTSLPQK